MSCSKLTEPVEGLTGSLGRPLVRSADDNLDFDLESEVGRDGSMEDSLVVLNLYPWNLTLFPGR